METYVDDFETDFEKWREETTEKERHLAENRISEKEVLNKMTKIVFNQHHLQNLKSAIGEVLDVFTDILETPTKSYKDVKSRIEKVHTNCWNKIQERYSLRGDDEVDALTDAEKDSNNITALVLKFISHIDKCTQSVIEKLEEKHRDIIVMEGKVKHMEEKLCQAEDMFLHQKSMYMETSSKNAGLSASKTHLEELLKEKSKKIEELERSDNVQLWGHEKNRLLKETNERIKKLEEELEEIKQGREQYKRRMSNIDNSYQKMKMRQQMMKEKSEKSSAVDEIDAVVDRETTEQLSRTNFLQDKEIAYLERELYALQSSTVGVIGGMKIDISKLGPRMVNDNGQMDKDFEQLSSRVRKVYTAVLDGEVTKAKEELPAHYRYHEADNFRVKKMRRLSQPTLPTTRVLHTILDENKQKESTPIEPIQECENPVIVNPTTRKLHAINPLKYFPHMSQQFILDQFDKFVEYDQNGDGSLDLTEVVKVVQCLGFTFNAHQLQEAMEEVDKDHNHTLDFYEYLLIIDNIYRRNGRAELFKDGLSEIKKKNMSKSCVIQ